MCACVHVCVCVCVYPRVLSGCWEWKQTLWYMSLAISGNVLIDLAFSIGLLVDEIWFSSSSRVHGDIKR